MVSNRLLIAVHVLIVGSLACNFQSNLGGDQPDLAATVTANALTLEAPLATVEPSVEAATAVVEARVTSDTNCRTGPGQAYKKVLVAKRDQSFGVVGKSTEANYWIITNPTGGTCWLWGQYVVITGDASTLPEYPAPDKPKPDSTKTPKATNTAAPTATTAATAGPTTPRDPSGFTYNRVCGSGIATDGVTPMWVESITFTWDDNSNNEDGFKLYKGSTVLQTLPPNSQSTYDTLVYAQGTGGPLFDNYQLVAFNSAGGSFGGAVDVPRCP